VYCTHDRACLLSVRIANCNETDIFVISIVIVAAFKKVQTNGCKFLMASIMLIFRP
jgi:hypothetical protein